MPLYRFNLKHPDAVANQTDHLPPEQREAEVEKLDFFFRYGEYLRVEIDTDTMTANVIPEKPLPKK
jgi:hypothetical protein